MQIGIVGLGAIGAGMARRLARAGVQVIGYDDERGKGDHGHLGKKRMP